MLIQSSFFKFFAFFLGLILHLNKIIQKVGEESVEVIIEATLKNKKKTIYESADLLYHLLLMWNKLNINLEDIAKELNRRKK